MSEITYSPTIQIQRNFQGSVDYSQILQSFMKSLADRTTEQVISNVTLEPSKDQIINIGVPYGKSAVVITIKSSYSGSATNGITIKVYYSPDGQNYDTDTDEIYEHPFTAGQTKQKTYIIAAVQPYIRVVISNNDTAENVTLDGVWITML